MEALQQSQFVAGTRCRVAVGLERGIAERHLRPACASLARACALLAKPSDAQDDDDLVWATTARLQTRPPA